MRRVRGRLELTQDEVADRARIDRSLYNAYENKRRVPDLENIERVARALSVPPQEILDLAGDQGAVAELAVQLADLRSRVDRLETV